MHELRASQTQLERHKRLLLIGDGLKLLKQNAFQTPQSPAQASLVIRRNHHTGDVPLDALRWGLIPHWCQDPTGGRKPINAKCEIVAAPTFRDP
jgi:putative SOS response-associated peptidase YedK